MKKTLLLFLALVFVLLPVSCANDGPPDDGTPAPKAHDGVFEGEYGKLVFNGDGKSVSLDITDEFAALSGLPAGKSDGSYVFLFHNGMIRYDKAEYFRIMINDKQYQFGVYPGQNDENTVAFFVDDLDGDAVFTKK